MADITKMVDVIVRVTVEVESENEIDAVSDQILNKLDEIAAVCDSEVVNTYSLAGQ